MSDRFEKTIADYLMPMDDLKDGPSDTMYFLHRRGGLVFCEGYVHPPDGLYGSLIKYPDPKGHIDIFGRKFNWTHRYYKEGNLEILPYHEQVEKQIGVLPELANRTPPPPYAEYFFHFLMEDFRGFFDGMHSLNTLLETSPRLKEIVSSVEELLGVPRNRVGCTGSMAYGYYEERLEDIDLLFFGSVEENFKIVRKIRRLKLDDPGREVFELGRSWPLRFVHLGAIICPFFKYSRKSEIPLRRFDMEVIGESVTASGVVRDDRHTVYMPVVLGLDHLKINGIKSDPMELIVYDGAERGEYFKNSRLNIKARLIIIKGGGDARKALLATSPVSVKVV